MLRMLKRLVRRLIPRSISTTLMAYRILSFSFGHYKSLSKQECVDKEGNPIPWYTYPAIEYLRQLDFSDRTIFEYGSGNSTKFWAKNCRKLISVEDNPSWYAKVRPELLGNVEYLFADNPKEYAESIRRYADKFDIIIIDGNYRFECAQIAPSMLRDDGFIIFDNSDWYEKTAAHLKTLDFIQVDISGFGPQRGYTWTTSFYFSRNVRLEPRHARYPMYSTGAIHRTEAHQRGELKQNKNCAVSQIFA